MEDRLRVLVVDDDEAIRKLVTKLFEREDFHVDAARDGQEALDRLATDDFDVVLLDLMMPRVDGFGVIAHLRRHAPEMLSRVVVMTAFTAAARERLESTCRLITKPFDVGDLVQAVRSCAAGA